jgi:uncharacterized membrane protein YdfJ with MMPL/SSD domain
MGERWARLITQRPLATVATTVVGLLVLAASVLRLQLELAQGHCSDRFAAAIEL